MQRTEWDVIIVGGGSAGLSAALMLGRSRRRVLVVDAGEPRNRSATHMHGVLGHDHSSPLDLLAAGRAELTRYDDIVIESGTVASATPLDTDAIGFEVVLESGERHTARRLLLATGLRDELPDIPGLAGQWGRNAALCPYCDGWEVRDRRIAVIATDATNAHQAQLMRQLSPQVTFYSQGLNLPAAARTGLEARGIAIESRTVVEIVGDDETGGLRGIRLDDGTEHEADSIFVAPRQVPNDRLLRELRARTIRQNGVDWVLVDPSGRTNVRGLWAAGNIATAQSSVPVAMAAGNLAGSGINGDLVEEDIAEAVAATPRDDG